MTIKPKRESQNMETKIDIKKTTLLVIDIQNDLIKVKEEYSNLNTINMAKGGHSLLKCLLVKYKKVNR